MVALKVRVQLEDFNAQEEEKRLLSDRRDIGAIISFIGLCRDEEPPLSALELEHYAGMAETEIEAVAKEASSRWPIFGATIIHRYGMIKPGAQIVLTLVAAAHREAAFASAQFIMDYLKTKAPFWKKRHFLDGAASDWIAPKIEDDLALLRWQESKPPGG
jgi:molybdopterin synthase catalytic subunit